MPTVTHSVIDPVGGQPVGVRSVEVRVVAPNPLDRVYRATDGFEIAPTELVTLTPDGTGTYPATFSLLLADNASLLPAGSRYVVRMVLVGDNPQAPRGGVDIVVPAGAGPYRLVDLLNAQPDTVGALVPGVTPAGIYDATRTYYLRQIVTHQGSAYVARGTTLGVAPGTNPDVWQLLVTGGAGGGAVASVNGDTGAVVLDAAKVGAQPADPDLAVIAALDATAPGVIASDGSGWFRKTYAQLRAALGLATVATSGSASDLITGTLAEARIDNEIARDSEVSTAKGEAISAAALDATARVAAHRDAADPHGDRAWATQRFTRSAARTLLPGWAAATDGCVFWQTQRTDITGVTGCNFRGGYTVLGPDLLNARLVFANFGVQDDPGPNPITVASTIEQGASPFRCAVTFGGSETVTIAPGGYAISDPVAVRVATGGKLYLRTYVSVADTAKSIPVNYYQGAGDFRIDTAQTDVRATSTFTSGASHWGYGPVAILADTLPDDLVAFIGASFTFGVGDFPNHLGWSSRWAARDVVPYVKLATPGEKALTFSQPYYSYRRLGFASGATVALCAHGVNDGFGPPASIEPTKAAMQAIWADLKRRGVRKIYQSTITPATTSTDSWATVAGQSDDTVRWSTAQLAELNAWIRSKPAPLDGVIDLADIVMTARDSNRWRPGYTADGIHPSGAGHLAILDLLPPLGNLAGTIPTAPAALSGLAATVAGPTSATLTWSPADRATAYRVETKTRSSATWAVASTAANGTSCTVTGLAANTVHDFRVRAVNSGGFGIEATTSATLGTPVTAYAADTFTRANTSGSPGTTEEGALAWTATGATFGINGNTMQQQGGIGGHSRCVVDTGQADGVLSVKLASASASNRGLYFRASADGSTGYVFYCASSGYRLRRITSTSGTTDTIQDTASPAPAVGDVLTVVMSGSSITCKVNGATVITATDATYTGTRHGPWVAFGANGQQWDDFSHNAL